VNEGELFAFAGLWDGWKNGEGQRIKTCSILTTTPNAVISTVHDRMPVILDPASYDVWLDPGMQDVAAIFEPLRPYHAGLMRCYPGHAAWQTMTRNVRGLSSLLKFRMGCSSPKASLEGIEVLPFSTCRVPIVSASSSST